MKQAESDLPHVFALVAEKLVVHTSGLRNRVSGPWVGPDTVLGQLLSFWQFLASAYQLLVLGTLVPPP